MQHIQAKNWGYLRKHVGYHSIKAAGAGADVAEVETRDRHSLVSLAVPNEVDEEDPRHLRDEQVSQIFFNCLVTELFVAATFNDTSTTTLPTCLRNMTHPRWLNETAYAENWVTADDTDGFNAGGGIGGGRKGRRLAVKVAGELAKVDMTGVSGRVARGPSVSSVSTTIVVHVHCMHMQCA